MMAPVAMGSPPLPGSLTRVAPAELDRDTLSRCRAGGESRTIEQQRAQSFGPDTAHRVVFGPEVPPPLLRGLGRLTRPRRRGLLFSVIRPALAVSFMLALSVPARADVPPPPDSADAHCSLAEQCPHGVFCPYAFRPGRAPEAGEVPVGDACRTEAAAKGLAQRCRSGGNYSGQNLFCPAGETGSWKRSPPIEPVPTPDTLPASPTPSVAPPAPTEAPKTSRCAASPGATGGSANPFLPLAALAWLAAARRRR